MGRNAPTGEAAYFASQLAFSTTSLDSSSINYLEVSQQNYSYGFPQ